MFDGNVFGLRSGNQWLVAFGGATNAMYHCWQLAVIGEITN